MPKPAALLRLDGRSETIAVTPGPSFQFVATRRSYVARNRDRWTSGKKPGQSDSAPLQPYLAQQELQAIAAKLIKVGIPSSRKSAELASDRNCP